MEIIWCTSYYGYHLVHLRQVHPLKAKRCINIVDTPFCYSVGGDGFEPPKA